MPISNSPELLIIADDDLTYGINHGYYPEMSLQIKTGVLEICSVDTDFSKYNLSKMPLGNGKDIYVRNPYANKYVYMWESDILDTLINDKSYAIKEVLVRMGARHITLIENTKDTTSSTTQINNRAKVKFAEVNVDSNYERHSSVNISSQIESHDVNRQAKSAVDVESFMRKYGLLGDSKLLMLLDRLKEDKLLHGTEKYSVSFCTELESALNIAANINFKLFSNKLDFSHKNNHIHTITKELMIEFD